MSSIIALEKICRNFQQGEQSIQILKSIDLNIKKGEFVAIIGQSGSGKSTLMNIIGCLDTPSSGCCKINGVDTAKMNSDELSTLRREQFGFIFQRYNLLASLTALENVMLPAIYAGVGEKERKERATRLLTELGLESKIHNKPNELSGGQQQRVSIARALMNGGEIILADEPTGALDSKSGEQVMAILTDLNKKGHTIILVTHDAKVASFADRLIEIKDGEIIKDETKPSKQEQVLHHQKVKMKKNYFSKWKSQFVESFKMSLQAIVSHRMRSFLTMLGIVIGITSVVSISGIGEGTKEQILSVFNSLGSNYIAVTNKSYISSSGLSFEDAEVIEDLDFVKAVTPGISKSGLLKYQNEKFSVTFTGVEDNKTPRLLAEELDKGRFFTPDELQGAEQVVIINKYLKEKIFKDGQAVGKTIYFAQLPFKVVGVTKPMENSQKNPQDLAWTPNTTILQKIIGNQHRGLFSIIIYTKSGVNMYLAEQAIKRYLLTRHGVNDFNIISSDSILKTVESTMGILTLMISSVAFISLLVGGIGVMNIMLVSVSERTREIGVRMAIGAKQSNIKQQFIIEAILLCFIGGLIALGLSYLINLIFNHYVTMFKMIISSSTMMIAMIVSSIIGLVFGYIPAKNAAKLNPIEALSNE